MLLKTRVKHRFLLLDRSLDVSVVCVDMLLLAAFTFILLLGYGNLQGSISYFLATRSSQRNAEAANDVDSKY